MAPSPLTPLPREQSVAAFVQLAGDDTKSWMLGLVRSYSVADNQYEIADIAPENEKNPDIYHVPVSHVIKFPQDAGGDRFSAGELVLALWFDHEQLQWTSILYPAVVLTKHEAQDGAYVVAVRYSGDQALNYVQEQRLLKIPPSLYHECLGLFDAVAQSSSLPDDVEEAKLEPSSKRR
ncbi:hypothetical protein KIPB_000764 [Kipferlia bialata]|uniref:SGF29 C-terminal domain-containing protein n=1 Tax=Kipferlia bialata TaxID=797122 RepID=A0A391NZV0_9EUKA|nr:hypothetical protein KIPB_000764 [Kipferlia bialata]|eukprot:g764.t1